LLTNVNQSLLRLHESVQRLTHRMFGVLLVGIILCDPGSAIPQTTAVQSTDSLRFEVVSIKPSKLTRPASIRVLPDGFEAVGFPLGDTLLLAYFPPPFFKHDSQLRGDPKWLFEDKYDIEARVSSKDVARWQGLGQDSYTYKPAVVLQEMLKAVLEERCLLRVHTVDSKSVGYALTIAKHKKPLVMVDKSKDHPSQGDLVPDGGYRTRSMEDGGEVQTFYQTSMSGFAEWLSLSANYPIVDRTGLKEKYHFSIRRTSPDSAADLSPILPFRLDEIGITLVKEEITVKMLYIDQIHKPSAN
jgi:uncharacterized protein (TIGR03435 family)